MAYICAAWDEKNPCIVIQSNEYMKKVAAAGYCPISPVQLLGAYDDTDTEELAARKRAEEEYLSHCRMLVVCGNEVNDSVKHDIQLAKNLNIMVTTLEGITAVGRAGK